MNGIYSITNYDCMNPSKGYNSKSGGSLNKHWSDDLMLRTKELRSHKENNPMHGKHYTEETKAIMREKTLGRVMSQETKDKLSDAYKGKLVKSMYCVEADIIFPSSLEVAKFAGLKSRNSIFENIAGRKSYTGRHPETNEPLHWIKLEDKIS